MLDMDMLNVLFFKGNKSVNEDTIVSLMRTITIYPISVQIFKDTFNLSPLGSGLIILERAIDASFVIDKFNNTMVNGGPFIVKTYNVHDNPDLYAVPKDPDMHIINYKLFVGNLPPSITEDQLRPLFAGFGDIIDMTVMRHRPSYVSAWVWGFGVLDLLMS